MINNKHATLEHEASSHKKLKNTFKLVSLYQDPTLMELWYGFPVMENLAYEAGMPPLAISKTVDTDKPRVKNKQNTRALDGKNVIPTN